MRRRLIVTGAVFASVLSWALPATGAAQAIIRYRGAVVRVPAGWPVYDLTAHPGLCVRFDRRAVYLGLPSAQQRCPAVAVGRPRAILIEPRGAGAVVIRRASQTIVGRSGPNAARAARPGGGARLGGAARAGRPPAASAAGAIFTGFGFDACTAPSAATMSRWQASPYRAIGIYIGGTNMACSQPNLTTSWVRAESTAGWHFILTYVGLQAPGNSCGCAAIAPGQAASQGRAAASDAVSEASALGLGPGNPIYFDMEAYSRTSEDTSAVLSFLGGWTTRLHADGYKSGVYSSSGSGVSDLAANYGTSYPEPDDIWFAEWNGSRSTASSYIPAGDWPSHRRLHQYQGDHTETYGGATLSIDNNALDGETAGAGQTVLIPDGTFIQLTSTQQVFRMAGGAPLYVNDPSSVGNPQSYTQVSPEGYAALNPVPIDGTFLRTASGLLYRVAGGFAFSITQPSLFPGATGVMVDSWDLNNTDNPLAHLSPSPADGTVVKGLPSGRYWTFLGGQRLRTTRGPAVALDDAGLAQFPMKPCVVPRLSHLTLVGARAVLAHTDCLLGSVVRRRKPRRGHSLHVVRQFPGPRASRPALTAVAVTLG